MMLYTHRIEHGIKGGMDNDSLKAALIRLNDTLASLQKRNDTHATPLLAIASKQDDLAAIEARATDIKKHCLHVVVAGAGGAGLSGRILATSKAPSTVQMHFLDNIDPDTIEDCLQRIDMARSHFIIISKSGSTVETLGQFLVLLTRAKEALGTKANVHFTVITMPGDNALRRIAEKEGITILDHAVDIGGRFSVLTNAGLLPAAIAGLDIKSLRQGAQSVVQALDATRMPPDCPPAVGAALQFVHMQQGRHLSVMLPYSERLAGFSSWYRQGWAESLGKRGKGSTPIRAVGTTDQHSQLQLYLDGPKDKLFHLITLKRLGQGQKISVPGDAELSYLHGKTTGDIMDAEQRATFETLVKNNCPVRLIELTRCDEASLGALLMHFMLEILFMAALLDVNPFDQPAVEEGKMLTKQYLLKGTP